MNETTYNVRVYKTEIYRGKKVTTYYVRWKVDGQEWREPFRHSGQADSFRSKLVTAAKDGEAFSIATGRPLAWERDQPKEPSISWYTLALDYTAAKWPYAAPNHRRSIAEALIDATEAMFSTGSPYPRAEIRRALSLWAFSGVHSRGLGATRRCAAVVELLARVEHACGSCRMSRGLAASRVTWSRGCGL